MDLRAALCCTPRNQDVIVRHLSFALALASTNIIRSLSKTLPQGWGDERDAYSLQYLMR